MALCCLVSAQENEVKKPALDPEPVRDITFEEAVDLGLAYNLGIKSARLDALMERFRVAEADAAWDTTLSSEAGASETRVPARSSLGGADIIDTDSAFFALGVTKPLRVGPTLGLNWRSDYSFNNSSFSTINPAYDSFLELSLTVPLLRGRGRHVQEADLRASRASAEGARYQLLQDAADLVQAVAAAYWNLVYMQERILVLEKSVQVAREIEATERRKMQPDIGRSTRLDVTTAEAETKRREVAVIQGELDAADASDELRRLILPFNGTSEDNFTLRARGVPGEKAEVSSLQTLIDRALLRRPDFMKTQTDLAQLVEAVVVARNQQRMQLDFSTNVAWRSLDGTPVDSSVEIFDAQPSAGANLVFNVPIGRRAARAAVRRATLNLEKGRVARQELLNSIVIEVRKARRALRGAFAEIEATNKEVAAAAAALAGERKRLQRGSGTVLDVARLEENVTDAQLRLVLVKTNMEAARVDVLHVSGTLIAELKIELDKDLVPTRR